jgi:hypothetical protein
LPWTAVSDDAVLYPAADSRKLPPRVDFTEPDYLNLVDPATAGGLGEGEGYSVGVMDTAVARAIANQGALGMYCNSLMLNKALYGCLPDSPPAPLEDIIDSAVKTGAELNRVFASALNRRKKRAAKGQSGTGNESGRTVPDDTSRLEQARLAVVDYLSHFPPQKRPSVMLGALASVYGQEKVLMDTAVWLGASESEQLFLWQEGVTPAQATLAALRETTLLDEVIRTTEGLIVYPTGLSTGE